MQSLPSADINFTRWIVEAEEAAAAKKNGNIFKWRHYTDPGKVLLSKWNEDKQQRRGTSLPILSANFPSRVHQASFFLFFLIDSPAELRREDKSKTSVTLSMLAHAIGVHGKISPIAPSPVFAIRRQTSALFTFCTWAEWHLLSDFPLLPRS